MCSEQTANEFLNQYAGRVFSFSEAIEIQKIANSLPSPVGANIKWGNSQTGQPITIGTSN